MFKLELDYQLFISPPMHEHGRGLTLTRSLEIPFVPTEQISIYGKDMEEQGSEPCGFPLKDIMWDTDRQVFLATTSLIISDCSLTAIPLSIASALDLGWRFGSFLDVYPDCGQPRVRLGEPAAPVPHPRSRDIGDDDGADELWRRRRDRRSPYVNAVFGAMIRTMAELYNNEAAAYVMDKTGKFYTEEQIKAERYGAYGRWWKMHRQFEEMSIGHQVAWRDRMIKKYHSLQVVVEAMG